MTNLHSNRMLEAVLAGVDDAIIIADEQGRIVLLNMAARDCFGIDKDESPSGEWIRAVDFIVPGNNRPLIGEDHPVRRTLSGEFLTNIELTIVPLLGSPAMVNLSSEPLQNGDGETIGALLRLRDLSVRKHSEGDSGPLDSHKQISAESSAADLELESFIYSVSHDLQAPLRHIIGFATLLDEEYSAATDATGKSYIERIQQSCERIQALINDLLQLSRKTRGRMFVSVVNLSEIAGVITGELKKAEPQRKVEIDIQPGIEVEGDQRLLIELLRHLISNAWKFTRKKSVASICFGAEMKGDTMHYFVRDNGVGFDMNLAEKLFLPFRRMHGRDYPGNGIGLATALRIINRHNGRIWADAKPNHGATFWFTLG